MLFNSGTFLQFFAAFVLLYFCLRNHLGARNLLIVTASYLFYGWWDYRFLSLLIISSLIDYAVGLGLQRFTAPVPRKRLLIVSLVANLSILGFFKYFDFFVSSFAELLGRLGLQVEVSTLRVVLPVGISFYTFQTMSYAIDVYRGVIKPTRNLVEFFSFVSFFPQLVAGPIERAQHLLPQFSQTRHITRSDLREGVWLCLWGFFKKIVLADNFAPLVEMVYDHPRPGSLMVALATVAFGLQIYCDFSGYSDIARGTARLLGFDIMVNFNLPYAAANLREFWARWHISLSTWLRDYLYVPLGGNRQGTFRTYRNLFLTMLLGGLWHGAAWNFVAWGFWHGGGLIIYRWWAGLSASRVRQHKARAPENDASGGSRNSIQGTAASPLPHAPAEPGQTEAVRPSSNRRPKSWVGWCLTMAFVFYGWLLFRAGSWQQLLSLTGALGDFILLPWTANYCVVLAIFMAPLVAVQVWQYRMNDLLAPMRLPLWGRTLLQGALLISVVIFWQKDKVAFIYFQF